MELFKTVLFVLFIFVFSIVSLFLFMCLVFTVVSLIKGQKLPRRKIKSQDNNRNVFVRLFWDFPKAFVRDFFSRNPDRMGIHGIYIFAGEQGSGKTIAAIQFIRKQLKKYPLISVKSNISISFQHGKISDWRDIIFSNNGEIGEIDFIDEMQNWFSSNESNNFPSEMLTEVTQQRKQHKCIVGTSQVFTRLSKPIREQVKFLCLPMTFLGCLTFVRVYKPVLDDSGSMISKKFVSCYFFVHDNELRECYDTYEKVQRLALIRVLISLNKR